MPDKYNLLTKHFLKETTPKEELLVDAFINSNEAEYLILKKFWLNNKISLSEFNKTLAWEAIVEKTNQHKFKNTVTLLRRLAAIAAVFLLFAIVTTWHYQVKEITPALTKVLGDKKAIKLADGSIVFLNKNAVFSYPEYFDGDQRLVKLEGEAYFEIARDVSRPFKITGTHASVEVLGTSFNLKTDIESTEVSVTSGKVKVISAYNNQEVILTKDQYAVVSNKHLVKYEEQRGNFLSWKTGSFVFKEMPITDVVADLNTYYGNKINLNKEDVDCLLSASFNKDSISEVLEILKLSCNLKTNEKNGKYELE